MQSALDELILDGFVTAHGPAGSFVADAPPHLTDYALVFPTDPKDEKSPMWVPFYHAILNAAEELRQTRGPKFHAHLLNPIADQHLLLTRVQKHLVGGVIFVCETWPADELQLLDTARMPRVAVLHSAGSPTMPAVRSDNCDFMTKALGTLASAGRCRVGLISSESTSAELEHFDRECGRLKLETRRYWRVRTGHQDMAGIRDLVHLLMQDPQQRPDALLVMNEYSLPGTLAGLEAAGARVGSNVELIAYRLYPVRTRFAMPLRPFFYDAREILRECLRIIERQRRGQQVPVTTFLPALAECDLSDQQSSGLT